MHGLGLEAEHILLAFGPDFIIDTLGTEGVGGVVDGVVGEVGGASDDEGIGVTLVWTTGVGKIWLNDRSFKTWM